MSMAQPNFPGTLQTQGSEDDTQHTIDQVRSKEDETPLAPSRLTESLLTKDSESGSQCRPTTVPLRHREDSDSSDGPIAPKRRQMLVSMIIIRV